jgi:hypothetical protein
MSYGARSAPWRYPGLAWASPDFAPGARSSRPSAHPGY